MKNLIDLLQGLKDSFVQLISSTGGKGPSCTRLIYLVNGLGAVICAMIATIGGVLTYCYSQQASAVYWGGVASLWTASLGFGTLAKNHQSAATKAIESAKYGRMQPVAVSGD